MIKVFVIVIVAAVGMDCSPQLQTILSSALLNRWNTKQEKLPNLVDLAQSLNLTILVDSLNKTGLDNTIDHEGPFTLFAPTNEAFKRIPYFAKNVSPKQLLSYHVARKNISVDTFKNDLLVRSLLSKRNIRINVYKDKQVVTANGCKILKGPYRAFNGLLYIVDDVMWSVYERQGSVLSELENLPVGEFDHVIQGFMITGLGKVLVTKGPFTVLAPLDRAWSKLPTPVIDKILNNDTLFVEVMQRHIVPGSWYSDGLQDGHKLKTMDGQQVQVNISADEFHIDNATVTLADFTAGNGLIHVLDTVLLPEFL